MLLFCSLTLFQDFQVSLFSLYRDAFLLYNLIMKHDDRRKETGKMLLDVTKYLLTAGLIGGVLTEKVTLAFGFIFVALAIVVFLIGFFTIPPKKEV